MGGGALAWLRSAAGLPRPGGPAPENEEGGGGGGREGGREGLTDQPIMGTLRATGHLQFLVYYSFKCVEMFFVSLFFLKRSNFTFIFAQLGIGDNQFPLKSCRDGKWGLPSLEMNFYLPDCFFYNELVNDPQS